MDFSSNLVMEMELKIHEVKLEHDQNQAGSNLSHHIVPNSVLDCREIRGGKKSRLRSSDTHVRKDSES